MAIAELYTKRKIVDIKDTDDTIDVEYRVRVMRLKDKDQLRQFLRDYEEFLPDGIQLFRDASDRAVEELLKQIRRVTDHARRGQMLAEPTEAAALFAPPMITFPRMFSQSYDAEELAKGRKVHMTWGEAFKRLATEGMITKLMRTQERMFRRVIEVKDQVNEMVDTSWKPGEKIPGMIEAEAPGNSSQAVENKDKIN